jgi:hypothetical protein
MSTLKFTQADGEFHVYVNEFFAGSIYMEVDGFYVYSPIQHHGGYVESWFLQGLVNKLDELNKIGR